MTITLFFPKNVFFQNSGVKNPHFPAGANRPQPGVAEPLIRKGFDGIAIILMENNSLLRDLGEKTQ